MGALVPSVNERRLVSGEDCNHTSGRTDADNYSNLNSFNFFAIKLSKGLNETTLMVAFHTQRLKDSICRELCLNLNVAAEENSSHVFRRSVKLEF